LSRDVTAVFVHWRHQKDAALMGLVEKFRKRNKVEVVLLEKPGENPAMPVTRTV
jgi:hypothetical protein